MRECTAPLNYRVEARESLVDSLYRQSRETPERILFQRPLLSRWVNVSAWQFAAEVRALSRGWISLGVAPGDRIALCCHTRYEWMLTAYSVWSCGAVLVPIYPSSSTEQIRHIVEDAGVSYLMVETARHLTTVPDKNSLPSLRSVYAIEKAGLDSVIAAGRGVVEANTELERRIEELSADKLACIIFTSGTTGNPKGVQLSHGNLLHEIRALNRRTVAQDPIQPGKRVLNFLPLAHVFQLAISLLCIETGATQAYWSDFSTVTKQLQRFKPHIFIAVPRVYEKIAEGLQRKFRVLGSLGMAIFNHAYHAAVEYSRLMDKPYTPVALRITHRLYDLLIYRTIRATLGGELWWVVCGGGSLNSEIVHFLRGAGVDVYEGYGLTETSAAITVNSPGEWRVGSIGHPLPGCAVRIADDGELLLKGGMVTSGYWHNDAATAAAFVDGWFCTGDLGSLDSEGYVYLTGRKKEIIVTAGGKNVSPTQLEDIIERCPLVSRAVVIGDGRKYVGCLITLDRGAVRAWLQSNRRDPHLSMEKLQRDPHIHGLIQAAIDTANEQVSRAESIRRFRILSRDLTEEDGELTPTLKLKRRVINLHFQDDIEELYRAKRR